MKKTPKNPQRGRASFILKTAAVVLFCLAGIYACKNEMDKSISPSSTNAKASASTSAPQPLPGGRRNFSVVLGNFDNSGNTWNRIITWTFNETNGTVNATAYTWDSADKKGIATFTASAHTCTFDGITKSCSMYTPYGWVYPSGQYKSWVGNYTYSGNTLAIQWATIAGAATTARDSWTVTDIPASGVARVNLLSSNYNLTHGHGYGSNASWTTFKKIQDIPRVDYSSTTGRHVVSTGSTVLGTVSSSGWKGAAMGLSGFTTPSTGNVCLHAKKATTACDTVLASNGGSCQTNRRGIIYHMASQNTNRQLAYTNYCVCLATDATYPCYGGNLHPSAYMQVINDTGALVGFVGIEAQNPVSASYNGRFQFQLLDFTGIPW